VIGFLGEGLRSAECFQLLVIYLM